MTLRDYTPARVALGRTGNAPSLREILAFQLAHARARDAVHAPFNAHALAAALNGQIVQSAARDRHQYLTRPDLGRQLHPASRTLLHAQFQPPPADLAIILADGLSPLATERHAPPLLRHLWPLLENWTLSPPVIAQQARVAIGDEIGALLQVRAVLILIGERPGLTSPDSLGAYLTWSPRPGRTDADRNCVSNIRPEGLPPEAAAHLLAILLNAARQTGLSGVKLKPPASLVS